MYRILHLSDLHARQSSTWSTTPILLQAKRTILDQASKENIDLVVFTGDIAFSGKSEEYAIAHEWLDDLCLNSSGLNLQKGQILFVPGNHDVDRQLIKPAAAAIEESLRNATTQAAVARFYDDDESKKALLNRHNAFFAFCTSFLGEAEGTANCWSKTFRANPNGRIRVDGLNTSWLCRGGDDHRRLLVGQSQLTDVIKLHTAAVKTHGEPDVRITLMHHPIADLMEFDEDNTGDHLKQNTDIVLRGHLHKVGSIEHITNSGRYLEFAAGALYECHRAPNCFSLLDIADDLCTLRVTPFLWDHGRWIHDRNVYPTDDGVGVFPLKGQLNTGGSVIVSQQSREVLPGLNAVGNATEGIDADGSSPLTISSSIPRFQHVPSSQDRVIRQSELEEAVSRLRASRKLIINKEAGAKYEGFIACILAELRRNSDPTALEALHIRCAGATTNKQFQDTIELIADQSFTVFGKALRENGESVLILDDLDFSNSDDLPPAISIEGTIEALHDFCPNVSIIRLTALSCPKGSDPIRIGRLDEADTRSYLNNAPRPVHLSSLVDYRRVHRVTGGLPIRLDEFIGALDVADIEEAIGQADAQPVVTADALHKNIVSEIDELLNCTADDMKRTRSLLWTLAILDQGESLSSIKRLDGRAPIWPRNAYYLQSRGCLESVSVTSKLAAARRSAPATDGDKILRLPRLVRDYVLSIMTSEERERIIRNVANLYFSDDWRNGVVRMRRRLAIGTEISTHQSGNELVVLKHLLQGPSVYFGGDARAAFSLALGYASQLKAKGFYGEAYEAAKDMLATMDGMPAYYPKEDVYHIQLLAAACARMVGDRDTCVKYLQTALPLVRQSGVKATLTDALVNLAMALQSLKRNPEAREAAEEILKVAPKDSSDYLQAQATLAEITMSRRDAVRFLRDLATKAKNLGHLTVADNATLEVVSDTDDTEEKLKMLNAIKSRRDLSYNFVRATIRRVETLIDADRQDELTGIDHDDLWFSYNLAYSQRMASIFDWCHRVCWNYLMTMNGEQQLGELYMHSSFVWRLRGENNEELVYSAKLQEVAKRHPGTNALTVVLGYVTRRVADLAKSLSLD